MRELFYIPIVHAPEDMGSHLAEVKKQYIARYGSSKWSDHTEAVGKFWVELTKTLLNLPVDYAKVRLYQDSLPVCGHEPEIVQMLANSGNRNYQLVSELIKKGAVVVGSEDPELLVQEREQFAKRKSASYDHLMERRDRYIAQRIDATLNDGEIGLLLIGALHKVLDKLPKDIHVYESISDLKERN